MDLFTTLGLNEVLLFTMVLSRLSGLVMVAPIYGSREVPMQIRAFVAIVLALLITPTQTHVTLSMPTTLPGYVMLMGADLLIGLLLGLGVLILLAGVQLAGQLISQVSGMALANVVDPTFGENTSLFSQLLNLITISVFVIAGGHRIVLAGVLDTFSVIPPGRAAVPLEISGAVNAVFSQSFVLATRAAAPVVAAQLLATSIMGLISRTMPQLNILAVGFGINSLVTLGTLSVSLGAIVWAFQGQFDPTWQALLDAVLEQAAP